MNPEPAATAEAFVRAINRQNAGEVATLMTDDHVFIDSDGAQYRGKEQMRMGWEQYFQMFPENRWSVPAAWRAVVRGGRLAEWRVYVNVEPILRIVTKHK